MLGTQNYKPVATQEGILNALNWRYATKAFDPQKKLTPEQWTTLEQALILSPSSYGLQPWKFVNVTDQILRTQLKPVSWNQSQITDASHLVVIAARNQMDAKYVEHYVETVAKERGIPTGNLEQYKQMMIGDVVNGPRAAVSGEWASRQCYIALGNILTVAATLGIDACPMEGFDTAAYDKILGLGGSGYHSVVVCALGYRSAADKSAGMKKVRFPAKEIMIRK